MYATTISTFCYNGRKINKYFNAILNRFSFAGDTMLCTFAVYGKLFNYTWNCNCTSLKIRIRNRIIRDCININKYQFFKDCWVSPRFMWLNIYIMISAFMEDLQQSGSFADETVKTPKVCWHNFFKFRIMRRIKFTASCRRRQPWYIRS